MHLSSSRSVMSRYKRCSPRVGTFTICRRPASSQKERSVSLHDCSERSASAMQGGIVPNACWLWMLHSASSDWMVALSSGSGGLYDTPIKKGPVSACKIIHTRSLSSDFDNDVTLDCTETLANTATPPHLRPSSLPRLATSSYASSVMLSIDRSKNIHLSRQALAQFSRRVELLLAPENG